MSTGNAKSLHSPYGASYLCDMGFFDHCLAGYNGWIGVGGLRFRLGIIYPIQGCPRFCDMHHLNLCHPNGESRVSIRCDLSELTCTV